MFAIRYFSTLFAFSTQWFFSTHSLAFSRAQSASVITLLLYHAGEMGSYFLVEPPYRSALDDIRKFYPRLTFTQNIITDLAWVQCGDLMPFSDDVLAKFYYSHDSKWKNANLTVFINNEADCDGHATAFLATALRKLTISTAYAIDIDNKEKWPTRLETIGRGRANIIQAAKMLAGYLRHFNWSTCAIVCDVKRNPSIRTVVQGIRTGLASALGTNITMLEIDGFSSDTNFTFIMEDLNRQTRVIMYYVFGGTLRKCMLAAHALNMTQGNHVHLVNIIQRHPVYGNYNPNYGDELGEVAKLAYRTVMFTEKDVSEDFPPPGTDGYLLREGWRNTSAAKFNTTYPPDAVTYHITAAYAMLMMTAQVVNELLEANQPALMTDGANIARKLYNRTFHLRTGKFSFDQFGSVAGSNYFAKQFDQNTKLSTMQRIQVEPLQISEVNSVRWPGPLWPVPNRPRCGYDGQDPVCWRPGNSDRAAVAAGAGASIVMVLLLTSLLGLVLRRKLGGQVWWMLVGEKIKYGRLDSKARQLEQSYMEIRKLECHV